MPSPSRATSTSSPPSRQVNSIKLVSLAKLGRMLLLAVATLLALSSAIQPVQAVKFDLIATQNPRQKCIWNYAMSDTLVVIT